MEQKLSSEQNPPNNGLKPGATPDATKNMKQPSNTPKGQGQLEALLSKQIRCVLIKGDPGTGKTTLAIDLLARYGKGLYISSRASLREAALHNDVLRGLLEKNLISELEITEKKGGLRFEDYRLGGAEDVLRAVIKAPEIMGTDPLVILDSWDFFGKLMEPVERQKTEQALFAMSEATNTKLLFVAETADQTPIDYMVDAVLLLEDSVHENHRIRRAIWKKLRSFEIPQRSYPYTLHGGTFSMMRGPYIPDIGSYATSNTADLVDIVPKKHTTFTYSTGSEDLDAFLGGAGGFTRGSFVLLEMGEHVGSNWHVPLSASIGGNFIANGGCVVTIPSLGLSPRMIKIFTARHFSPEVVNSSLRICHFYEGYADVDPCFVQLDSSSAGKAEDDLIKISTALKGGKQRPCYFFLGIEAMEDILGAENLGNIGAATSIFLKKTGDLMICGVKHGSKLLTKLSNSTDIHLKMDQIDGALMLYSVKPPSAIYNLYYDYSLGYPKVRLIPMV